MLIKSRAPVRIDFGGGWTDAPPYSTEVGGAVLNAAITLYTHVTLSPLEDIPPSESRIVLKSLDFDLEVKANSINDLRYDEKIDFVKAALKKMHPKGNFELITSSDAPLGAGLGASGSLGVALVGLLNRVKNGNLTGKQIPEMARDIEVEELGVRGGKQDQYAAMFGGFNYLEFKDPDVELFPLKLEAEIIFHLQQNSLLCYTGRSRVSGDIHENVFGNYEKREEKTVRALNILKEIPSKMTDALVKADIEKFAQLLNQNWQNQKQLHPSVTNPTIEKAFHVAEKMGAMAGKACGAGGGGCIYFLCKPGKRAAVEKSLKSLDLQIIPFTFDFSGLTIEKQF